MPSLKSLGLATAISLLTACENPAEKPVEQPEVTSTQKEVASACERVHAAIGMEVIVEQLASDPAAWKLFPAPLAKAAWKDAHAQAMAAAASVAFKNKDQATCFGEIKEGQ